MAGEYHHFRVDRQPRAAVVHLTDPQLFDRVVVSDMEEELIRFVEDEQPQQMVVSFAGVSRCSSEIVNALLRARKRLAEKKSAVKLCCLSGEIQTVFRVLKLDGAVFEIFETLEEATSSF